VAPERGFNNNWALENEDFLANAAVVNAGVLSATSAPGDWGEMLLNDGALRALNLQGASQFRLYFTLPNNKDGMVDWLRFYSGNSQQTGTQPQLVVDYAVP